MDVIPIVMGGLTGGLTGFVCGSALGEAIWVRCLTGAPIHVIDAAAQQGHVAGGIAGSMLGGGVGGALVNAAMDELYPEDCEL